MATLTETTPVTETRPAVAEAAPVVGKAPRNVAVDAYRGLVMLLMMAEVLELSRVSTAYPTSLFWKILAYNQTHVGWSGCSLHDTIQPGFSFLVGVALPYSIASRMAKGARFVDLFWHALWRSFALVTLGVFLRSMDHSMTYFTFEDTLSQIGFGYPFLFLLGYCSSKAQSLKWVWTSLGCILFAYWLAWALYPAAPANFNWQSVGVPSAWNTQHNFTGFAAHWNKNYNFGNRFDQWFLNLFPREHPFVYNEGGYLTLSFIPTLGTMILGLMAGRWLRESRSGESRTSESRSLEPRPMVPMNKLLIAGVSGMVLGLALDYSHICPVVKRIWTPSWTIFSGGICFLFLAAFSWVVEVKGFKKWAFPLVVVGMNSIVAYCIAHFLEGFLDSTFRIHLGRNFFQFAGVGLEPFFRGAVMLLCYWLILFWMYRRKLYLKI